VETPIIMDPTLTRVTSSSHLRHLDREGRKAFKVYLADLQELFLSRCEVTR
jgi:hypothetical protein